ncbi:MAG: GDP-mannose 4,6-dehydratase [Elusimicrobia bacterium GWD2_63_28]|nr:MAG: GDP-mannose 4,6-dehydratase [Elusimicrobia bacterium GWD2_63_28]
MKKALITGYRGQDGSYLSQLLLAKGYDVYGADRAGDTGLWRMRELGIEGKVKEVSLDLLESTNINYALAKVKPDEIYNFAAQSFVGISFDQPVLTAEINAVGVARLLEGVRQARPQARFFQASTAELFGSMGSAQKNETTDFHPRSPYAVSKLYAHWLTVNYRQAHGLYACNGILFNHESPLRGEEFVTRKIAAAAARIKKGQLEKVAVGNLDALRDWGYAREYVEGMWLMLQQPKADDYILATGETHSVREFIETAFAAAGIKLEWKGRGLAEKGVDAKNGKVRVEVSKAFYRPADVKELVGDANKARKLLGWAPKTKFNDLAALMVDAETKRLEGKKVKP